MTHPALIVGLITAALATLLFFPEDGLSRLVNQGFEPGTMLFVGDVMLGRSVEQHMERGGLQYPFEAIPGFLFEPDVTVANFESAIPETHVPTPNFSFAFSVPVGYLGVLKEEGVDALSFANNHALDYGQKNYEYAMEACEESGIVCFGHPTNVSEASTAVVASGSTKVGLIGLHTLFAAPDEETVATLLEELSKTTDVQIAYVHWGDEYEASHNAVQERLAKVLIDAGADVVIGHHPHVVQDIAIYKDKPIFYSLGNFIFDQYWSLETQQGMTLKLHIDAKEIEYELIPVTSVGTKSQVHLFPEEEAKDIVAALIARSPSVAPYFKDGILTIPR